MSKDLHNLYETIQSPRDSLFSLELLVVKHYLLTILFILTKECGDYSIYILNEF